MESAELSPRPLLTDPARRERAKLQLYVACQVIGWSLFSGMQLFFTLAFPEQPERPDVLRVVCLIGMIGAIGLLLSHAARAYISRRSWTLLGWKRLLPRLLLASIVLSCLWSLLGFGYTYGLLRETWTSKYSPGLSLTLSVVNGAFVYLAWFCLYFFYQLFDRFNRLEVERLSLLATVKEAELRALKAQVNPHFIFNSLNSVRALIDEDPARARQSVTQLANLLRYSLQSGQLETVPFEEELRTVNDYLALEQVRHEERLRLRLDIAPEALRQPVPPMLLQTLVENAVKYGISSCPDGGEIAITARCADGRLELRVTNPGELSLTARAAAGSGSTGLGLRNASDRLRLLFGEKATCVLREEPAGTVVAVVSMPLDLQVAASLRHFERTRAGMPLVVPAAGSAAEVVR